MLYTRLIITVLSLFRYVIYFKIITIIRTYVFIHDLRLYEVTYCIFADPVINHPGDLGQGSNLLVCNGNNFRHSTITQCQDGSCTPLHFTGLLTRCSVWISVQLVDSDILNVAVARACNRSIFVVADFAQILLTKNNEWRRLGLGQVEMLPPYILGLVLICH